MCPPCTAAWHVAVAVAVACLPPTRLPTSTATGRLPPSRCTRQPVLSAMTTVVVAAAASSQARCSWGCRQAGAAGTAGQGGCRRERMGRAARHSHACILCPLPAPTQLQTHLSGLLLPPHDKGKGAVGGQLVSRLKIKVQALRCLQAGEGDAEESGLAGRHVRGGHDPHAAQLPAGKPLRHHLQQAVDLQCSAAAVRC